MLWNITTIEEWEIDRHEALLRRARATGGFLEGPDGERIQIKRQEFPYDIGVWGNLVQAMGTWNVSIFQSSICSSLQDLGRCLRGFFHSPQPPVCQVGWNLKRTALKVAVSQLTFQRHTLIKAQIQSSAGHLLTQIVYPAQEGHMKSPQHVLRVIPRLTTDRTHLLDKAKLMTPKIGIGTMDDPGPQA